MEGNETSWLLTNITANNSLHLHNQTETLNPIYVFTPAGVLVKRVLCFFLWTVGAMGFLGNCFIQYFLWQKPATNPVHSNRFMKNLYVYGKSLSLSDLLSCAISVPLLCIQISFDIFQRSWACKMVRYFNFIFPTITMNNLVVLSVEKYLSTRTVPRTCSVSTVRKMIICAWVLGLVVMMFPAAAYDGVSVNVNNTHFTIICRNDETFYPFKITLIIFPLQYVLPSVFVTYINICLLKTVWDRGRGRVNNGMKNAFQAHLRAMRIKGTILLIALTFAFIVPYFFFIANTAYTQIAKPQREFSTDYVTRYGTAAIVYSNAFVNFIIYFAQMKDFRVFLKKFFCRRKNDIHQPEILAGDRNAISLALKPRQDIARIQDIRMERKEPKNVQVVEL